MICDVKYRSVLSVAGVKLWFAGSCRLAGLNAQATPRELGPFHTMGDFPACGFANFEPDQWVMFIDREMLIKARLIMMKVQIGVA